MGPAVGQGLSIALAIGSPHQNQLKFSGSRKENPARPSFSPGDGSACQHTGCILDPFLPRQLLSAPQDPSPQA